MTELLRRTISVVLIFIFGCGLITAQSTRDSILLKARSHVEILASDTMYGRGYQQDGHLKAAKYIAEEFQSYGLKPLEYPSNPEHPYFQYFSFALNLIDTAEVELNDEKLKVGKDYIVHPGSDKAEWEGVVKDIGYGLPEDFEKVPKNSAVVFRSGLPEKLAKNEDYAKWKNDFEKLNLASNMNVPVVIILRKKLTYSLSAYPMDIPVIEMLESSWPKKVKELDVDIDRHLGKIRSQNVIGWIEGSVYPDSFIMVSAHYDHLGMQEDAVFTGANDNASGTSMMLTMAEHFAQPGNRPEYSMVFIGFGAEEAGLIGSRHYVTNDPVFPLEQIKFLLNLDLMSNGDEGITVVASTEFPSEFELLKAVNDSLEAVPAVKPRGNAANSDHYFFVESGVPAFFIYTLGGPPHYHDIFDRPEALTYSKYVEVRDLLIAFLKRMQ